MNRITRNAVKRRMAVVFVEHKSRQKVEEVDEPCGYEAIGIAQLHAVYEVPSILVTIASEKNGR